MTDENSTRSPLGSVEGVGKAAVAVVGLVYALGLIVVTLHLARYGASGLGLLQEQYVLAGMWALFPLAGVGFVCIVIVGSTLEEFRKSKAERSPTTPIDEQQKKSFRTTMKRGFAALTKIWQALFVALSLLLLTSFFLGFVTQQFLAADTSVVSRRELLLTAAKVAGFGASIGLFSLGGWGFITARNTRGLLLGTMMFGFSLVSALGYVGYFAASIYPNIPATVGGGRARPVQIILKTDAMAQLPRDLLRGSSQAKATSFDLLLFATDKSYIIIDPSDSRRAIEIHKDLVAAVRTLSR